MYERPRRRVRRDDHAEHAAAPLEPSLGLAPATILALQRSAGNAAVARFVAPSRPTIARAPHRPKVGMQIKLGKDTWTVDQSRPNDPTIKISKPKPGNKGKEIKSIDWASTDFTIIRANTDLDYDMRNATGPNAGVIFESARAKALEMLKEKVQSAGNLKKQQLDRLKKVALTDFVKVKAGEWTMNWIEGLENHPAREWKFTIDADNPLADSDQEPHVGWTAEAPISHHPMSPVVSKATGHIWLKQVTEWRT
jgi:hypothetical protein